MPYTFYRFYLSPECRDVKRCQRYFYIRARKRLEVFDHEHNLLVNSGEADAAILENLAKSRSAQNLAESRRISHNLSESYNLAKSRQISQNLAESRSSPNSRRISHNLSDSYNLTKSRRISQNLAQSQ
jgi:hypothetical protein